jgi:hypothetical protein
MKSISSQVYSGNAFGKNLLGTTDTQAASGSHIHPRYEDLLASGVKYYDVYTWYYTSSNQLGNWLVSGEKLSRWFSESSMKLGELGKSGSAYWDAWKWYNTSSNQFSNLLASAQIYTTIVISGTKYSQAYQSGQRVLDLFNHDLYVASSTAIVNFTASANINVTMISTISSNALSGALLAGSGTKYSEDYYWYNTSGSQFGNWLQSGTKLSQWFVESSSKLSEGTGAGSYYPSSLGKALSSNAFYSGLAEVNMLTDVDTQTTTPVRDYTLKWNGTKWVPALYNATFVFTIASFTDNETTTQLIGSGVWKAINTVTFGATYNNGPPDTAWTQLSINGAAYSKIGTMVGPNYTTGLNDVSAINYPAAKDQTLQFRISANCGSDTNSLAETAITFRNYVYWGTLNINTGFTEVNVESLAGSELTNDHTLSAKSVNATAGQYIVVAHPASYTALPSGTDYETNGNGGTGFRFSGVTCAFQPKETVSVTNTAGYTENYYVYGSTVAGLGNFSLYTYTSKTTLNKIFYGLTTKTDTFIESDVQDLLYGSITDDSTQTWSSLTAGVNDYLLFAFPKRWGINGTDYTFYDNGTGFAASFNAPETVSITNSEGWSEDFYVYRSVNKGLGTIVIRTS